MTTESLTKQALDLPLEERIRLAEALLGSIGEGLPSSDDRTAIERAARRDAEMTGGVVEGRTHIMKTVRRGLGCQ